MPQSSNVIGRVVKRLFGTLPGLLTLVVTWDALIVATLSLFSGPVRPLGLAELLRMDLGDAHRVGRIIMLYHSLAIPFVAALVYLILDQVPMGAPEEERRVRRSIVVPVTAGYMLTSLGGMTFAYGGRSWIAHGIYLVGLSLVFYAGVLLAIALWPSRRWATDPTRYAHLAGVPLERLAFFLVAVFTLVSAAIGGTAGAFFGNGFAAFLAEDIVRQEVHTTFQLMIIAHLHIMLTLIDVMILLLVIRTYRVSGPGPQDRRAPDHHWHGHRHFCHLVGHRLGGRPQGDQHRLGVSTTRRHPRRHLGLCLLDPRADR